jgi:hypothetical protein
VSWKALALAITCLLAASCGSFAAPEDGVLVRASNTSEHGATIASGSYFETVEPGDSWSWTVSRDEVSTVWVVRSAGDVVEVQFEEGYETVTVRVAPSGITVN